jgi:pimeloyl-ACP methyl ester carboxylesterase
MPNDRPVMIAYGEKGTGQPLFLAHGIASWSYCWHRTVDALAEHFRVICFDAKNSGFSDKPTQAEKPGHKIVEMARVIQALSSEPAIVVAESLGALISLGLVQQFPALVDRLGTDQRANFSQASAQLGNATALRGVDRLARLD